MSDSVDRTLDGEALGDRDAILETVETPRRPTRAETPSAPLWEPGKKIGRYTPVSELGSGAMGIVLAAYDPELDRKVALKLHLPRKTRKEAARARLLREAQALAALNHANVVTVHDVGVHEGRVFVAMEFVEGLTLTDWLHNGAEGRSWRDVVEVLAAAGAGLAAAHRQGLVHRDFKPDNVMVGDDGRVRVMDFGLARAGDDDVYAELEDPNAGLRRSSGSVLETPLTQTGAMLGTPAYMSPEQFAGLEASARSDQFAFCVTFFEALYEQRPFPGETMAQLAFAVTHGKMVELPRGDVPGWLRALVLRGLSSSPDDRFADMDALLEALEQGERRHRNGRRLMLASAVVSVGLWAWGWTTYDQRQRERACSEGAVEELAQWSDNRRQSLRRAQAGLPEAEVDTLVPRFDDAVTRWRQARERVCVEAEVHERWTASHLAGATWCVAQSKHELVALLEGLADDHRGPAADGLRLLAKQPPPSRCLQAARLAGRGPTPPSESLAPALDLSQQLARARVATQLGDPLEPSQLEALQATAEALGHDPLLARVYDLRGRAHADPEASIRAYEIAVAAGDWELAVEVAGSLMSGTRDPDDLGLARIWGTQMEVALHHRGDPRGLGRAQRDFELGSAYARAGELEAARREFKNALGIRERELGRGDPLVAETRAALRALASEDLHPSRPSNPAESH